MKVDKNKLDKIIRASQYICNETHKVIPSKIWNKIYENCPLHETICVNEYIWKWVKNQRGNNPNEH